MVPDWTAINSYDLRDRKFESGNWQKYPTIGKTDDVLTLPDVKVTLATTDMPSPKQCMSYIKETLNPAHEILLG